jgi:cell division protein FtsI/penicillin-binding protein 2
VDTGTAETAVGPSPARIAGKTGTAQRMGTPYLNCSFAAYAPRERPQVVVLVLAKVLRDEERKASGGSVAAPAVRAVVERTLEYRKEPAPPAPSPTAGTGGPGAEPEAR